VYAPHNFYRGGNEFRQLQRKAHPLKRATLAQVLDHLEHVAKVAGVDHVGLGSDFDGIDSPPAGLEDVAAFPRLTQGLLDRGWTDDAVRKVLGGNLLSKYSMIGRFYATLPSLEFLQRVIARVLDERDVSYEHQQLDSVMSYLTAVALNVPFAEALQRSVQWASHYDIDAWVGEHFSRPLSHYALESERTLTATVAADVRALIEMKVATFGEHPAGLGKFTRSMFARDLRRSFVAAERRIGAAS
jgi:hypothetical protein